MATKTKGIFERKPTGLMVPIRELNMEEPEGIVLGFRQEMVSIEAESGEGSISCGAGVGTDYIILSWRPKKGDDHMAVVRGIELYKTWGQEFMPPELLAEMPGVTVP